MSNAELEALILCYLDGTATRDQVVRLRNALQASPEIRQRFHARVRLHKAQMAFLRGRAYLDAAQAVAGVARFAQRAGRIFAHACVLALVFVQLRVTLPAEYSGLMLYVEDPLAEEVTAEGVTVPPTDSMPIVVAEVMPDEMPEMALPTLTIPDMFNPVEDPGLNEA
ncbi:MAG: hypothetical protein CAK89_08285 [Opitutia bacterium AMD-G3]|nr:MAG: hypothetical protein CAK89_08285 [Opitutae bacterium AMD-G3]